MKGIVSSSLRAWVRPFFSEEARFLITAKFRRDIHQTTAATAYDRYPETFAKVASLLPKGSATRILSFGCSTGEEVATLRGYFPNAQIIGAEISGRRLAACRRLKLDGKVLFVRSSPQRLQALAPFDAIFAMAVLQRLPHLVHDQGLKTIAHLYPFSRFDHQLSAFDRWLNPGGLMIIQNAQYRFADTTIAKRYSVRGKATISAALQHFDRNGALNEGPPYSDVIFQKER